MRIVQIARGAHRKVAIVDDGLLRLVQGRDSVYALALAALESGERLDAVAQRSAFGEIIHYDDVFEGRSEWRLLPSADHPADPARCLVSGTGLTHMTSALNRQAMHAAQEELTDSMRMFRWGVEGGRPAAGEIGVAPEWFYKGSGSVLRGHNAPLAVPAYAEDGGEEPEIAGVYIVDAEGLPRRIGMTQGNEFSDHKFEKRNYLYLAGSKLRNCSIGPELVTDPDFGEVPGTVSIERDGQVLWSRDVRSGESVMCHSLANLEHHHFKFEGHRRPGDLHVHFLGADAFSFGAGIALQAGDVMSVNFTGFGRALRNPLRVEPGPPRIVPVRPL